MPFTAIVNTAEVVVKMRDNNTLQPVVNVLHAFIPDADQSSANLTLLAGAVESAIYTNRSTFSGGVNLETVTARGLSSVGAAESVVPFPSGAVGTGGAIKDPTACGLVKLLTTGRGREYRGRIYWGGLSDTQITAGSYTLSSTQHSAYGTLMDAIATNLAALTPASTLVVASKKLGASTPLQSYVVEQLVATQRRRLPRP